MKHPRAGRPRVRRAPSWWEFSKTIDSKERNQSNNKKNVSNENKQRRSDGEIWVKVVVVVMMIRRGERDEEVGEGEADEVIRFGSGCGATDCRTRRAGQSAGRVLRHLTGGSD